MRLEKIHCFDYLMLMMMVAVINIFLAGCHKHGDPEANINNENIKHHSMQSDSKLNQQPSGIIKDSQRVIHITARKFEFIPDRIVVKKGEMVKLEVTSEDVTHGIKIEKYEIDRKLEPNKTEIITFTADKAGHFKFHCSVFCGLGHTGMKGELIVLEE